MPGWVIAIQGKVRARGKGLSNPKLTTGEIEVEVEEFFLLSAAKVPPFSIADEMIEANEELRLKYRYLDMRRGNLTANLILRHLGDNSDPDLYLEYLEDPKGLIGRETERMLEVSSENPETLIDFIDFHFA